MKISELLQKTLNNRLVLTREDKDYVDKYFQPYKVKAGDYIIREKETEKYSYFIEKGILRCWTYDADAEEKTFWFSFPNEFSFSGVSFILQEPSEYNVQAVTECILWRISHADVEKLYSLSYRVKEAMELLTAEIFRKVLKRNINLIKLKPYEYYHYILTEKKEYIKYIPLKYIASYLGITPQALSRIRRSIT